MKSCIVYSIFLTLCPLMGIAQPPDTLWTRVYGWSGSESGSWIEQTPDKGFIIAGYTSTDLGWLDIWLVKTDSLGDTLWTKIYGGDQYDQAGSVQQTDDGGYIITGGTSSFGSSIDLWLLRTDSLGDTLWTKTYGDTGYDYGHALQITDDGQYIITGWKEVNNRDVWLLKVDTLGDTIWTKCYGDSLQDEGWDVKQTTDGGYIITGYTFSNATTTDLWLLKTDSLGDTLWTKRYGGAAFDDGCSVQQTSDNGFIITGRTTSFGAGYWDAWLLKTDAYGDTLWTHTYGGPNSDRSRSVQIMPDSGYVLFGDTQPYGMGHLDVWLVRTDIDGSLLWEGTYGGALSELGWCCRLTSDIGFILLGATHSFGAGALDLLLVRLDSEPVGIDEYMTSEIDEDRVEIFPNPFKNRINIRLNISCKNSQTSAAIYNVLGQKIKELHVMYGTLGASECTWDGHDDHGNRTPNGIYFLNIFTNDTVITKEIILLR